MKKICTKCGKNKALEEYYSRQSECKSCNNARQREHRKTDKGKAARARYNKSDKGKVTQAKYNKSDESKAAKAKYRKSDEGKAANAKYKKTDKGKAMIARSNSNKKYWKSKTLNTLEAKEFNYIIFLQDGKCAWCGRTFTDELKPTRDHIYPVSKGGDFIKENVQALCQSDNSKKGIQEIDYRSEMHKKMIAAMITP